MKTSVKIYSVLTITMIFGFICTAAYAESLDGKSFSGKTGLLGENANEDDTIIFKDGRFISTGCQEYGFSGAPYHTKTDGGKVHFVSDTYSDKYGRIIWSGTVEDKEVVATYIWFDKGKFETPEQIKKFHGKLN